MYIIESYLQNVYNSKKLNLLYCNIVNKLLLIMVDVKLYIRSYHYLTLFLLNLVYIMFIWNNQLHFLKYISYSAPKMRSLYWGNENLK